MNYPPLAMTSSAPSFTDIHITEDAAAETYVYEHGWQSWSPAGVYPSDTPQSPRPHRDIWQTMAFRPEIPPPAHGFQGEGLLIVINADSTVDVFAAPEPDIVVPSIRARVQDEKVVVSANGTVLHQSAPSLSDGLQHIANMWANRLVDTPLTSLGPGWCSWYTYWNTVTSADIAANLDVIVAEDLPIDVVQIDDGYQAEIGDWLTDRPGFGNVVDIASRICDAGLTPGIWTAPFLVGANSQLAAQHPDWLIGGAVACAHHWGQEIRVLDVTHPDVAEHLHMVFATLRDRGFGFHKIDFIYGGAMVGQRHEDVAPIEAYRRGLRIIRDAVGPDSVILGCGAPLLPSIGLVDTMRISPDVMPAWEPDRADISQPAMRSALAAGRARAWMHGRLWVNDPDCVLVRPEVERPGPWQAYLTNLRGLAVSSDPLPDLDRTHLERTRELMQPADLGPVGWDPWAGPDQGLIHRAPASP
jgi:alpha-galactosidase